MVILFGKLLFHFFLLLWKACGINVDFFFVDAGLQLSNTSTSSIVGRSGACSGSSGGNGSASDSGDQGEPMDPQARAREIARHKEEAKRKRRKKKRTGSSLVSSCFQG